MATWTGLDKPRKITDIHGRRHFWYEIAGADIAGTDYLLIKAVAHGLTPECTLTYLAMSADGVAMLDPIVARAPGFTDNSIQVELRNAVAATKIHNQQPGCLVLSNSDFVLYPNADTDGLSMRISLVLAEGHDTRGV